MGPRPYETREQRFFHGREAEVEDLADRMLAERLTVLRGPSGVGKTSLLRAGVLPELERRGLDSAAPFRAVLLREWGSFAEASGTLVARTLSEALGETYDGESTVVEIAQRACRHSERLVLVFDQFEEVLRLGRGTASVVTDSVVDLYKSALPLHLVISLREEYVHHLGRLEAAAGGLFRRSVFLKPMRREAVRDALDRSAKTGDVELRDDAAGRVLAWFEEGYESPRAAEGAVDLLVTQTIMRELYELASRQEPGAASGRGVVIDRPLLDEYSGRRAVRDIVREALIRWIQRAVDGGPRPITATPPGWNGPPEELNGLVLALALRLGGRLSSGGYKLLLAQEQLARHILGRDLQALGHSPAQVTAILRGEPVPVPATAEDAPAGTAARCGWGRDEAAAQLVLAYRELVDRLRRENIIKTSLDPQRGPIVELVHDGMAEALDAWAARESRTLRGPLFAPTPVRGSDVLLPPRVQGLRIRKVAWKGCAIQSGEAGMRPRLEDVVFEGADLRGTIFLSCDLERVRFVGCNLTGVVFLDCRLGRAEGPVTFEGCRGDGLSVTMGAIGGLELESCNLPQFTLEDTVMEGEVRMRATHVSSGILVRLQRPPGAASGPRVRFDEACRGEFNSWDDASATFLPPLTPWANSGRRAPDPLRATTPEDATATPTPRA